MELSQVYELLERFEGSSLASFELTCSEFTLKLGKAAPVPAVLPAAAPAAAVSPVAAPHEEAEGTLLKAPLVGTFYAAPSPGAAPFATVGAQVKKGQTVCILEAMKMMSEIPAPCNCVIEEILVEDGTLVGYDAPLFRIREL